MAPGQDPAETDSRLTAYAHRLIADPGFQADADEEFAALLAFAAAVLAAGANGAAGSGPHGAAPP